MMLVLVLIFLAIFSGLAFYSMNPSDDDTDTDLPNDSQAGGDQAGDDQAGGDQAGDGSEARFFGSPPGLLALERPKNRFGGSREHRGMNPGAVQSLMRPTKFGVRRDVSAQLGDIHGMPNSLVNLGFPKIEKRNMIGPMSSTPY